MSNNLTPHQMVAYNAIIDFLAGPDQVLVIEGYAGTGKTHIMQAVVKTWSQMQNALQLINPHYVFRDITFTATTHKACEQLQKATGWDVQTIFQATGQKLAKAPGQKARMVDKKDFYQIDGGIVVVDEASNLDDYMVDTCFRRTINTKIIFLGDPAQTVPVGYVRAPVFDRGYPTVALTEVVRNHGQILELSSAFRMAVSSGQVPQGFVPNGQDVIWKPRMEFEQMMLNDFGAKDWSDGDSKYLSWTNESAVFYNRNLLNHLHGSPDFKPGDYVTVNSYVTPVDPNGRIYSANSTAFINTVNPGQSYGKKGKFYKLDGFRQTWFMPDDFKDQAKAMKEALHQGDGRAAREIDSWIDLRAVYAQTVNKAQGSTYKRVYLDLDDLKGAPTIQMCRLGYVGVSRASEQVILTGDLV